MSERKYLPTLADLIDRLTIVQLKQIFIPEHAADYTAERELITHDIDLILVNKGLTFGAKEVHAVAVIMLANRYIWENETKARGGRLRTGQALEAHAFDQQRAQHRKEHHRRLRGWPERSQG